MIGQSIGKLLIQLYSIFFTLISPNEEDDVNLYFRNVILEKQGENVGRTR